MVSIKNYKVLNNGIIAQLGYYDATDGLFFKSSNNIISLVIRSDGIIRGDKTLNGQLFSTTSAILGTNSYEGIQISKSTTSENYVMSIKLKSFERRLVKLRTVSINCITSANIIYKLYLVRNSGFSSPPFSGSLPIYNDVHSLSGVSVAIGSRIVATNILIAEISNNNWIPICTGSFNTNINIDCRELNTMDTTLFLSAGIQTGPAVENFNSDHLVLTCVVVNTGSNANEIIIASFTWLEYC